MATKRSKPSNIIPLANTNQVDDTLLKIAQLKTELKRINADAEESINKIRNGAKNTAEPILAEIEKFGTSIFAYAEYNRSNLFGKVKTIMLTFGSLGYRQSTKISVSKKTLDALKEMDMLDCISIKEAVNKDVLSTYPDELIKQAGAKKVVEDKFWYEVKEEEIVNTKNKVAAA